MEGRGKMESYFFMEINCSKQLVMGREYLRRTILVIFPPERKKENKKKEEEKMLQLWRGANFNRRHYYAGF